MLSYKLAPFLLLTT